MKKIILSVLVIIVGVLALTTTKAEEEVIVYDHIVIFGEFDTTMQDEVVPKIRQAIADNHGIVLDIRSPGGYTAVEIAIANELTMSQQPIIAVIHGYAYSAAALLALSADTIVMGYKSQILFHMPRDMDNNGNVTKIYDLRTSKGEVKILARYIAQVSNGARCFLSDNQVASMMLGTDEIMVSLDIKVIEANTCISLPLTEEILLEAGKGQDLINAHIKDLMDKAEQEAASKWPSIDI